MKRKTRSIVLISLIMAFIACLCTLVLSHSTSIAHAETSADYPGLEFMLINNGDEYNVRAANKQITQAAIPSTYNGWRK